MTEVMTIYASMMLYVETDGICLLLRKSPERGDSLIHCHIPVADSVYSSPELSDCRIKKTGFFVAVFYHVVGKHGIGETIITARLNDKMILQFFMIVPSTYR